MDGYSLWDGIFYPIKRKLDKANIESTRKVTFFSCIFEYELNLPKFISLSIEFFF